MTLQSVAVKDLKPGHVSQYPIMFDPHTVLVPSWHGISSETIDRLVKIGIETVYCEDLDACDLKKLSQLDRQWVSGKRRASQTVVEQAQQRYYLRTIKTLFHFQNEKFIPLIKTADSILKTSYHQLISKDGEFDHQPITKLIQSLVKFPFETVNPVWLIQIQSSSTIVVRMLCMTLMAVYWGNAKSWSLNQVYDLCKVMLFKDLGMLVVPKDEYMHPGDLKENEWQDIKKHSHVSATVISNRARYSSDVTRAIESHHEWYDGQGYPDHLSGRDIPYLARISQIIESFTVALFTMPYRPAKSVLQSIAELSRGREKKYDPVLLSEFVRVIGSYAPGSRIKLNNGKTGFVVNRFEGHEERPLIRLFDQTTGSLNMVNLIFDEQLYIEGTDESGHDEPAHQKVVQQIKSDLENSA